ncbi:MAG: hypothetical protein ABI837_09790, partial [Acidobacteriota bacterium]
MPAVLVVCESKDGKLRKISREALSIGSKLARSAGGELIAFVTDAVAAPETGSYGAQKAYVAKLDSYTTETHTSALTQVIKDANPAVVLVPGSSNGRDLAPRLAARLGVGVASDVSSLEWTEGKLRARRPVYSGKAFATVDVTGTPAIATTRANAFPVEETGGGSVEIVEVTLQPVESRARLVETKIPETGEMLIGEADI